MTKIERDADGKLLSVAGVVLKHAWEPGYWEGVLAGGQARHVHAVAGMPARVPVISPMHVISYRQMREAEVLAAVMDRYELYERARAALVDAELNARIAETMVTTRMTVATCVEDVIASAHLSREFGHEPGKIVMLAPIEYVEAKAAERINDASKPNKLN